LRKKLAQYASRNTRYEIAATEENRPEVFLDILPILYNIKRFKNERSKNKDKR